MKRILITLLCLITLSSAVFASDNGVLVQFGAVAEGSVSSINEMIENKTELNGDNLLKVFSGYGIEGKISAYRLMQLGCTVTIRPTEGRRLGVLVPSASIMIGGNNVNATAGIAADVIFKRGTGAEKDTMTASLNFPVSLKAGFNMNFRPFGISLGYYIPTGLGFHDILINGFKGFSPDWKNGRCTLSLLVSL